MSCTWYFVVLCCVLLCFVVLCCALLVRSSSFEPRHLTCCFCCSFSRNEQIVAAASLLSGISYEDVYHTNQTCGVFFAFCSGMLYDIKVRMRKEMNEETEDNEGSFDARDEGLMTDPDESMKVRTWSMSETKESGEKVKI